MINARISSIERYLGLQVGEGQYDSRLDTIERFLNLSSTDGSIIARIGTIENIIDLPVYIIEQPPSNLYFAANDQGSIGVRAIGKNLSYHWQFKRPYESAFSDLNSTSFPSAITDTLKFTYSTGYNNYSYRCKITSGSTTVYSSTCVIHTR